MVRFSRFLSRVPFCLSAVILLLFVIEVRADPSATLQVNAGAGKPISPDLIGVFFEDINYAADGGLYAELVQNRSFEYQPIERREWGPLSFWEVVELGGGRGTAVVDAGRPLHPNNPHYAVLDVSRVGHGVGLRNPGFDGIPVREGEEYVVSLFVRQLYKERRWGGPRVEEGDQFRIIARLEGPQGEPLGETTLSFQGSEWRRVEGRITATATQDDARLVLLTKQQGGLALDVISLFPRDTFKGRRNGLRRDLAESLAELRPRFVRFPGGCLVHGNGLSNMYRWKETIGPIHERRAQANIWGYHQTLGLGYYEYFQFCEDIGAKPLPVVPAAVCCQNSGHTAGVGQEGLPMDAMPGYIQEVLDLIQWANGAADSKWGALRAAAGHPAPFGLEYLGVGNEDHITPAFEERFRLIHEAVAERHPEITVIGTVGPAPDGPDFEQGWRIAHRLRVPMVDEHYYRSPRWFLENLKRYDAYQRGRVSVYLGEYAAHERDRRNTLRSALAEAAYLTQLERNADVVRLSSYAPLLAKQGHTQWRPDLIYFTNTSVCRSVNYFVQQMFSLASGDQYLVSELAGSPDGLVQSAVRDSATGRLFLKVVNTTDEAIPLEVSLRNTGGVAPEAECRVLAGDPLKVNELNGSDPLIPRTIRLSVSEEFTYKAPANSLSVIRLTAK